MIMVNKLYKKQIIRDVSLVVLVALLCSMAKEVGYLLEFISMYTLASLDKVFFGLALITIGSFAFLTGSIKEKCVRIVPILLVALLLITANRMYFGVKSDGVIDSAKVTQHQLDSFIWFGVDTESLKVE